MSNAKIKKVSARNIFDSRRNPTIEIELHTTNGVFYSSAPSGASRGKYEAVAIKAPKAIHNVNEVIAKNLWGKDPVKQKIIDKLTNFALAGIQYHQRRGSCR
ncbi:MAG: hypothetical protein HYW70_01340 [Candidatus Nealsonbacteria bacterium]|nr:hypothetical protein [Candidatus Nealsonbacteria bacterium]